MVISSLILNRVHRNKTDYKLIYLSPLINMLFNLQTRKLSDDEDASSVESLDYINDLGPPGKRRKLRDACSRPDIWNRGFQNPLRQANIEQFKA